MKKLWMGIAALVLVMGIGTSVYAAGADNSEGWFSKMLPFAKQMHPDLTDTQIKDMLNNCHGNKGSGTGNMMDNAQNRGNMMNF